MYRQQIAIHNADVFHRHSADAQQEIGVRLKQRRIHLIMAFDVLLRQQRFARRNATDER